MVRMWPVGAPNAPVAKLGHEPARELHSVPIRRALPGDAIGSAHFHPNFLVVEQCEQCLERGLFHPQRCIEAPHVVNDDGDGRAPERGREFRDQRRFHMNLQVPADPGEPLGEGDHLVDSWAARQMSHVVKACPAQSGSVQAPEFSIGNRQRDQTHAFVRAARSGNCISGDRVIESMAGRLHDHAMLNTQLLVQLEEQLLRRIGGRVASSFCERKACTGAENMHMSIACANRQFELWLAGCSHPVRRVCSRVGAMLHHCSLARVRSNAGS